MKSAFVKVGTGPGECVMVKNNTDLDLIETKISFKRYGNGEKWQDAIIRDIKDGRLFLELW